MDDDKSPMTARELELEVVANRDDWQVANEVKEHRKREQIRSMNTPVLWGHEQLVEKKIIHAGMSQRSLLNAFREMRFRLLKRTKTDNVVVLVSSLVEGGGASMVAFNLAATFALDRHKTALYVDCNPYNSSADSFLAQPDKLDKGLIDYLHDYDISLQQVIYPSGIERLRVVPAGASSESAAEFFNSKRMEILVAEIRSRYPDRFIVLDAPSVETSTEARILAQYCDHALVVVPFGRASESQLEAALDTVGNDRFAGFVFNN